MAARAQREHSPFVGQPFGALGERGVNLPHFEQSQLALAAVEVPAQGVDHARHRRGAHRRSILAKRV